MNRCLLFLFICCSVSIGSLHADHLSSHLLFTANLSGDQEVPEVTTDARGVGTFSLDESKTSLYIQIRVSNLSGPITGMHIHEAAAGSNGGVVFNLTAFLSGNRAKGVLRNLPKDVIAKMIQGAYYVNVHTEQNPGGEIRGQIGLETDYRYTAFMRGINEVPEVVTDGRGLGVFHLDHEKKSVQFDILFRNLSSDVTGAHLHNAVAGENGPAIFNFDTLIQGNRITGTWEPGSDFLTALLNGEIYVNVHTVNHPGGEIRGQITLLDGITFDARFSGAQEVPAVMTPGRGLGIVTVWPDLNELEYYILFDSLSGPVTGAHFHRANAGMNGGVVINLTPEINNDENFISGTVPYTLDVFNTLLNGHFYINLHTSAHPGGEIRAQVYRFAREGYTLEFNGGQEVPPVTTTGNGAGYVSIDRDQSNAHYRFVTNGLAGTFSAAHFHRAFPGMNGGVLHNITGAFDAFGSAEGYWGQNSTPAFVHSPLFRNNEVYVNIHTDLNPGGEIRGNITRNRGLFGNLPFDPGFSDDLILTAILSGDNEDPPVTTEALGLATVFFDSNKNTARINITATGLSGPITGVHIHEGDPGNNGPVMFPLVHEGNRVQMEITDITGLQLISLMNGGTYVNIHTAANPGGEIRGQLTLDQDISFVASLGGAQEEPPVVTDAQGLALINWAVGENTIEVNMQLTGLTSDLEGAHIHSGAPGENGPVLIDLMELWDDDIFRGDIELTIDALVSLLLGNAYLNIHTTDHPGGEIRGQLTYLPGITFDGWMDGLQENPFTTTSGTGLAVATIFPGLSDIALWMLADNVSGSISAAHLHQAPIGQNGGVIHDLSDDLVGNSILHLGVVDDGVLSSLLTGEVYINAHTAAFAGGEIRGQLIRRARDGYGFDFCPEQEVGGTVTAPGATGTGLVSVDRHHSNLNLFVVTDGLTGDLSASHIHEAAVGANGGVITDLTGLYENNNLLVYAAQVDTSLVRRIRSGNTYINIHTSAHPAGEIRGQIVKEFLCSIETSMDPIAEIISDIQLSPVPVNEVLNVSIEAQQSAEMQLSIVDVSGQVLQTRSLDVVQGENRFVIPTDALVPGFYLLMISDGKAAKALKFVK